MSTPKHQLGTIIYQSFIVVLALAVVTLGVYYYNSNKNVATQASTIVSLNAKINATELENIGLQSQVTNLVTEKNTLQTQVSTLTNETASLRSSVTKLSANVTNLTAKVTGLNTQLTEKNIQLGNLTTSNTNLKSQITSLNAQTSSLNTTVSSLQSQLSNQTTIVNMGRTVALENDKQILLPKNTTTILTYKTDFAGYIIVTLTSTNGVSFGMGNSQATNTWYGTYPSTGTVVTSSFKIPVIVGRTYIKITNPSMTSNAVVILYLSYV